MKWDSEEEKRVEVSKETKRSKTKTRKEVQLKRNVHNRKSKEVKARPFSHSESE